MKTFKISTHEGLDGEPYKSITCLICNKTSYDPLDIANEYCGYCYEFHDVLALRKTDENLREENN